MSSLTRISRMLAAAALLLVMPLGAWAEGDDAVTDSPPDTTPSASVTCVAQPLPVRAFEISAARLTCRVTGAPATDTSFSVSVAGADELVGLSSLSAEALGSASLNDGAGAFTAITRDGASLLQGQLTLTARLEPSGTLLAVPPPVPDQAALSPRSP